MQDALKRRCLAERALSICARASATADGYNEISMRAADIPDTTASVATLDQAGAVRMEAEELLRELAAVADAPRALTRLAEFSASLCRHVESWSSADLHLAGDVRELTARSAILSIIRGYQDSQQLVLTVMRIAAGTPQPTTDPAPRRRSRAARKAERIRRHRA